MINFDDALKTAISGVSDSFKSADRELHEMVAAASKSLAKLRGDVALELDPWKEDEDGVIYNLVFVSDGKQRKQREPVGSFIVSARGFPIVAGGNTEWQNPSLRVRAFAEEKGSRRIDDYNGLVNYFTALLSSQESPIVAKLAFIMRKAHADDDIPF